MAGSSTTTPSDYVAPWQVTDGGVTRGPSHHELVQLGAALEDDQMEERRARESVDDLASEYAFLDFQAAAIDRDVENMQQHGPDRHLDPAFDALVEQQGGVSPDVIDVDLEPEPAAPRVQQGTPAHSDPLTKLLYVRHTPSKRWEVFTAPWDATFHDTRALIAFWLGCHPLCLRILADGELVDRQRNFLYGEVVHVECGLEGGCRGEWQYGLRALTSRSS